VCVCVCVWCVCGVCVCVWCVCVWCVCGVCVVCVCVVCVCVCVCVVFRIDIISINLESVFWMDKKGKAVRLQALNSPEGSRKLSLPDFMTTAQDDGKVVILTHRPPLLPGNTTGTHFCLRLIRPQDHSATGRFMSLKNSNDNIGNRTHDLPVCSVVP
jgi:hypothetical protein